MMMAQWIYVMDVVMREDQAATQRRHRHRRRGRREREPARVAGATGVIDAVTFGATAQTSGRATATQRDVSVAGAASVPCARAASVAGSSS